MNTLIRYVISGGTGAVTNLATLFILVEFFNVWYLAAAILSFLVAFGVSFTMQKFFTFSDYGKDKIKIQSAIYLGVQMFNLGVNTLLMYASVDLLDIHYIVAQIFAGGIIAVYSFFVFKHFIFNSAATNMEVNFPTPCPACGIQDNRFWGNKAGYNLVKCGSCGVIFVSPMPEETASIYSQAYFNGGDEHGYVDYDRDKEPMRRTFEIYLKHIERVLGKKGKILDIGSATGHFMEIAKQYGWETEGVEISEYASKVGIAKGLKIHVGALEDIRLTEKTFDAITLLDSVEHLRDPKSALVEARRLLKDGGVLAVTSPDSSSLWAKLMGTKWQLVVPPEHLVLFDRKNFASMLIRIGYTPKLAINIGKSFTPAYIFQTLARWQGLSIWNKLARIANKSVLSNLKIPVNLRDNFFMAAKKS